MAASTTTAFKLNDTVSRSNGVAPADSLQVKQALHRLGHYKLPPWGITDFVDTPMFEGIAAFQKANGLTPDGMMRPDGPTERKLGQALLAVGRAPAAQPRRKSPRRDSGLSLAQQDFKLLAQAPGVEPMEVAEPQATAGQTSDKRPFYRRWLDSAVEAMEERNIRRAEMNLRAMILFGRMTGLDNAADNLVHFIEGKGKQKTLSREQARERDFIRDAEETNRQRFEAGFFKPRPLNPDVEYQVHLRQLRDGQSIRLPIKPNAEEDKRHSDHYDRRQTRKDNVLAGNVDEVFATGNSNLKSTAEKGFVATRRGNRIVIQGDVTHRWHDLYDFERGELSEPALILQRHGRAKPYDIEAVWRQRLIGEIELVGDEESGFTLGDATFHWKDLD